MGKFAKEDISHTTFASFYFLTSPQIHSSLKLNLTTILTYFLNYYYFSYILPFAMSSKSHLT